MFVKNRIGRVAMIMSLVALLALASLVSVSAVQYGDDKDTYLTGDAGTFFMHATVDLTGNVYTYSYQLTYQTADLSNEVYYVGVGNPENELYENALNTLNFWDPEWWPGDLTIEWADGVLGVGNTATFSYQSQAAPNWDVDVWAYAAGEWTSSGKTVGMGSAVPEPSSFLGLATALFGVAPFIRRRR